MFLYAWVLHHKDIIINNTFFFYLMALIIENNKRERRRDWDSKWPQASVPEVSAYHRFARQENLQLSRNESSFWRWLVKACWPSDLFHLVYHHPWLKSHVANPAMLLCWKNWVINCWQSCHSSGNWDRSISGHQRTAQAQSWPALSVPLLYISTKWQHNYGRADGNSWRRFKKKLPE